MMTGRITLWDSRRGMGVFAPDIAGDSAMLVPIANFFASGFDHAPCVGDEFEFAVRTRPDGRVEPFCFKVRSREVYSSSLAIRRPRGAVRPARPPLIEQVVALERYARLAAERDELLRSALSQQRDLAASMRAALESVLLTLREAHEFFESGRTAAGAAIIGGVAQLELPAPVADVPAPLLRPLPPVRSR